MRLLIFFFLIIPLKIGATSESFQLADIGFANSDNYIGIELGTGAEMEYRFLLCSTSKGSCYPINDCTYSESGILEKLSESKNESFKKEFDWIFLRSGKSKLKIDDFYLEFSSLLNRVRPDCFIQNRIKKNT